MASVDPEGLLFYNNSATFDIDQDVPWTCTMNSENPPAVRVDFGTSSDPNHFWASVSRSSAPLEYILNNTSIAVHHQGYG